MVKPPEDDDKCLMIKMKDKRKFFTHEKNYFQLIEFSKVFKAEVSVVKVKNAEILELEELAPAFCSQDYDSPKSEYQILEVKITQKRRKRGQILKNSKKINEYIEKKFSDGHLVSLRDIGRRFKKMELTPACLCNHLTGVRKNMEERGFRIEKIGGGKYKMKPPGESPGRPQAT